MEKIPLGGRYSIDMARMLWRGGSGERKTGVATG